MRLENITEEEFLASFTVEEAMQLGELVLKNGDRTMAVKFIGAATVMGLLEKQLQEQEATKAVEEQQPGGSRADEILSEEALERVAASRADVVPWYSRKRIRRVKRSPGYENS